MNLKDCWRCKRQDREVIWGPIAAALPVPDYTTLGVEGLTFSPSSSTGVRENNRPYRAIYPN